MTGFSKVDSLTYQFSSPAEKERLYGAPKSANRAVRRQMKKITKKRGSDYDAIMAQVETFKAHNALPEGIDLSTLTVEALLKVLAEGGK